MTIAESNTDELLDRSAAGDRSARARLLSHHRQKLRNLIAVRMDARLAARIDPSDVVQEALADADRRMPEYLSDRPLPFYLWLRELTLQRLVDLHRHHIRTQKRSIRHEEARLSYFTDDSVRQLAHRLIDPRSSPSSRLEKKYEVRRLHQALADLSERDRDVIVLRHLEQLSVKEIAAVLDITPGAVKLRHLRALERLRRQMIGEGGKQ